MATAFRATQQLAPSASNEPRAKVKRIEVAARAERATPGSVVFQADGRFLARFGEKLEYFIQDTPHRVKVPPQHAADVAATKWMVRGPGGGFALVGPAHVLVIRGGKFSMLALPTRGEGEVGEICAVVDDGRTFGIVTLETDDSDGPELWRSEGVIAEGGAWQEPLALPLGGEPRALSSGPYGYLVVGAKKQRARAMLLGFDDQTVVFTKGVNERGPLLTCVCSAARPSWAAGEGFVLAVERSGVHEEVLDAPEEPVAMGLDLAGSPWLLTPRSVMRRHVDGTTARWVAYHRAADGDPPHVGFGFSTSGVRVVDATGGGVHITPRDLRNWQSTQGA